MQEMYNTIVSKQISKCICFCVPIHVYVITNCSFLIHTHTHTSGRRLLPKAELSVSCLGSVSDYVFMQDNMQQRGKQSKETPTRS